MPETDSIDYDDKHYCQVCGNRNYIKVIDMIGSDVSECETTCIKCGHNDFWAFGFFQTYGNAHKVKVAFNEALEKIKALTTEDLCKMIGDTEPTCRPETCNGECQGMGWCETAKAFRKEQFGE